MEITTGLLAVYTHRDYTRMFINNNVVSLWLLTKRESGRLELKTLLGALLLGTKNAQLERNCVCFYKHSIIYAAAS